MYQSGVEGCTVELGAMLSLVGSILSDGGTFCDGVGRSEVEGLVEGLVIDLDVGCDVGQSEIEGRQEGRLVGSVLTPEGGSEYVTVGESVTNGTMLGLELG